MFLHCAKKNSSEFTCAKTKSLHATIDPYLKKEALTQRGINICVFIGFYQANTIER